MLVSISSLPSFPVPSVPTQWPKEKQHTSFLVTGFSMRTKCVNLWNELNTSKSANSVKLLAVKTRVVRLGREFASEGWILEIRLRASNRVCNRGDRGKFPKSWMSLSVKSMASCGYYIYTSTSAFPGDWEKDLHQQHPGSL